MPTTDVIFRIGTLNVTKANAELAAVAAALVAIGREVAKVVAEADKFSDLWSKLSTEQRKQVQAMDTATKGFVSTVSNMTAAGKLGAAGLKPTADQMASLSKLAAATAKNLGEGPEGAARRLEELTNSLIKGNDRGLKPYGIQLSKTGTLAQKQAEAFDKITDAASDLSIEIDGLDDKWAALNSSIDKEIGLMYDWLEGSPLLGSAIDGIKGKVDEWNRLMVDTNGGIADIIFSVEGMTLAFDTFTNSVSASVMQLLGFNKIADVYRARAGESGKKTAEKAKAFGEENATQAPPAPSAASASRPSGGGGGRRREKVEISTANPYEYEAKQEEERAAEIEDLVEGYQSLAASVDDLFEGMDSVAAQTDESTLALQYELEMLYQIRAAEMSRLDLLRQKYELRGLEMPADEQEELWDLEYEHSQRMIEMEENRLFNMERQVTMQDALKNAIRGSAVHMTASTALMRSGWQMTTNALQMGVRAAIQGRKDFGKAMKEMVADVLMSLAEMAAVQAVVQLAEAISDFASYQYATGAQHLAAMAAWIAVGVAAGAASAAISRAGGGGSSRAGSATSNVGSASSAASNASGGYSGGGYGDQGGSGEESVIIINVEGSMASLFNALKIETSRQRKSGESEGTF